jgi:hypothetical protein
MLSADFSDWNPTTLWIGVGVGAFCLLLIVGLIIAFVVRRRKKLSPASASSASSSRSSVYGSMAMIAPADAYGSSSATHLS